jgi:hypothetical protein
MQAAAPLDGEARAWESRAVRSVVPIALALLSTSCDAKVLTLLPDGGDAAIAGGNGGRAIFRRDAGQMQCTESRQCGGQQRYCEPSTGTCVECILDEHCSSQEACDPIAHRCAPACSRNDDCSRDWTPICNSARGVCVQCLNDSSCTDPEPFCESQKATCVECIGDRDCSRDRQFCQDGECRECLSDDGCPAGRRCSSEGSCVSTR